MDSIFQFKNLSPISWLGHGISTKNLGSVSDPQGKKNFFNHLSVPDRNIVEAEQVHGNHVALVTEKERGHLILKTDALITNLPEVVLFIKVADCVPILLADPEKKAVAAIHAGWRGTAQEITRITVAHMEDHFGTDPQDLIVGIGPSIGPCCYEIDSPVIETFERFPYKEEVILRRRGVHANLDLWNANKFQLISEGVKEENIEVAGICTHDNPDLFFSERKKKSRGRIGAVVWTRGLHLRKFGI